MNRTFSIIKPDAVKRNLIGHINQIIENAGLKIVSSKKMYLTKQQAEIFYSVHKERPFFNELTSYMSRSPIVAAFLEKDNAVSDFRKLIGDTDPSTADEGTIRKKYAISKGENSVHGSDSDDNALIEASFHFSGREILS